MEEPTLEEFRAQVKAVDDHLERAVKQAAERVMARRTAEKQCSGVRSFDWADPAVLDANPTRTMDQLRRPKDAVQRPAVKFHFTGF